MMKQELLNKLAEVFVELGSELNRLLVVYASGDPITGRPLWNSPLELAIVLDMDLERSGRFFSRSQPILAAEQVQHIEGAVGQAVPELPCIYRYAKLEQHEEKIRFYRERSLPELHYYEMAQGILRGRRVYLAEDFLLADFKRDLTQEWKEEAQFQERAHEKLREQFKTMELPQPETLTLPGLDVVWLGEHLLMMVAALARLRSHQLSKPASLLKNYNPRQRIRQEWQLLGRELRQTARCLVGQRSRYEPQNYLQLMEAVADMGILPYNEVAGLTMVCERLFPGRAGRHYSPEDVELLALIYDHQDSLEHYVEGCLRFLHSMLMN